MVLFFLLRPGTASVSGIDHLCQWRTGRLCSHWQGGPVPNVCRIVEFSGLLPRIVLYDVDSESRRDSEAASTKLIFKICKIFPTRGTSS